MRIDQVALFDMDGTIVDLEGQMRADLKKIGNENLPRNIFSEKIHPHIRQRVKLIKSQQGWWANLPVIESGLELMKLCKEIGYNIYILTQGPKHTKNAWAEKFEWCDKHVAPIALNHGISVTRDGKDLHYGRVLVDDFPGYMTSWLEHRPRGLGLMPITQSNRGFSHPQVVKYNPHPDKWRSQELVDKLNYAFNRPASEED